MEEEELESSPLRRYSTEKEKESMKRILFYLPRGIMILFILFISLFALDAFDAESSVLHQIIAFLIHLIPSFALTSVLIFAWRRPLAGALGCLLMSILFTILVHGPSGGSAFIILVIPSLLCSVLFLLEYLRGRGRRGDTP